MSDPLEIFVGIDGETVYPWAEFQKQGLLWLVNASVFNPRGHHLTMYYPHEDFNVSTGFKLVGDGKSPWAMPANDPTVIAAFKTSKKVLKC